MPRHPWAAWTGNVLHLGCWEVVLLRLLLPGRPGYCSRSHRWAVWPSLCLMGNTTGEECGKQRWPSSVSRRKHEGFGVPCQVSGIISTRLTAPSPQTPSGGLLREPHASERPAGAGMGSRSFSRRSPWQPAGERAERADCRCGVPRLASEHS